MRSEEHAGEGATAWAIRPAREQDLEQLREIIRGSPGAAPWPPELGSAPSQGPVSDMVLVAGDAAGLLGFTVARVVDEEGEILNIAVRPQDRRSGIASRLVQKVLAALETRGAQRVFLEVRESNRAAITLYEKQGFRQVGRRPSYYHGPVEDALVYGKDLTGR